MELDLNKNVKRTKSKKKQRKKRSDKQSESLLDVSSDEDFVISKPCPEQSPRNRTILQLKVILRGEKALVWRKIQVVSTGTFADLYSCIKEATGWNLSKYKAHQFIVHDQKKACAIYITKKKFFPKGKNCLSHKKSLDKFLTKKNDLILLELNLEKQWIFHVSVEKIFNVCGSEQDFPKFCGGRGQCLLE